jgi:hypothetical protein
MTDGVHLLGVRHHGPGSARSVLRALETLDPDIVLVEGPPDANDVLPLAAEAGLTPPVALLVYAPEQPRSAVIYPFAEYSPEWQAIQYALARRKPVRFIDLPQSNRLRLDSSAAEEEAEEPQRGDPLAPLAAAAGFSDAERWWDRLVESRSATDQDVFVAVHEMMCAVREQLGPEPALLERRREAHMRRCIRAARSEGHARIAVACGAYHTPALDPLPPAREDDELLKGLPKLRTAAAWVPWSYARLATSSGYGAGIESPVWYELLWRHHGEPGARWITRAARLLREADLPVSSAHVIETCRLAEALSAVRQHPLPGLVEYQDAAVAVLGAGDAQHLQLIHSQWHFDGRLGQVPESFPASPLQQDLAALQKRLRLPPKAEQKLLDLDLRETTDRERSHLLRRLRVLGIEWAQTAPAARGGKGSFHEYWLLQWQPEFAVALIEQSRYGHTIEQAATGRLIERASEAAGLPELVPLLEDALFADLGVAIGPLVSSMETRAAASADVLQLLAALSPLVNVRRYGNVRETDTSQVDAILEVLIPRLMIGLPAAMTGIDDDAARALSGSAAAAHSALQTLDDPARTQAWREMWQRTVESGATHPLLAGYGQRILYDAQVTSFESLAVALSAALSPGQSPQYSAAWVEGLLSGSGALLVHDDALRQLLDDWVRGVSPDPFLQVLPLLRRTFATFPFAERRVLGERLRARGGGASPVAAAAPTDFDTAAALATLPVLRTIWNIEPPP